MKDLRVWLQSRFPAVVRPPHTTVSIDIGGIELVLRDWEGSTVLDIVPREILSGEYNLIAMEFRRDDVVIDVGANIGIVALWLAKKHPDIRIIAVEPVPTTFSHLQENIALNRVDNITPLNCAVTRDGRICG